MLDRILLTNDDGIDAPGLEVLERIAQELAREVWVVAPEHDQSGVSHAISLHHPIRISQRGARRWAVTGTPGDCASGELQPATSAANNKKASCFIGSSEWRAWASGTLSRVSPISLGCAAPFQPQGARVAPLW